jgi:replicative DNA helicase
MMMLYRDEYYNPESYDKGVTEVIVVKNRDGQTGTVKVLSDMSLNRYMDLTPDNQIYLSRSGGY